MFLLWLRQLSQNGDQTPVSVLLPTKGRSSFPPSFFILLSFAWFYIFFSTRHVLQSPFSWCSAWTSVYSWCILAERCTPCPAIPPQSCSLLGEFLMWCSQTCFFLLCIFQYLLFLSHSVVSNSATPWTAACQASMFFTISWSLIQLMPI